MRKFYILMIAFFMLSGASYAYTYIPVTVNDVQRKYIKLLPQGQTEDPEAIIVFLHGINTSAADFADMTNAQGIADKLNAVVLLPEALPDETIVTNCVLGYAKQFGLIAFDELSYAWNAGASIDMAAVAGGYLSMLEMMCQGLPASKKLVLNGEVDDISFINEVIRLERLIHSVDDAQVFMVGASLGGAMTYKYAYSSESEVAAIAVIAGFIGAEVDYSTALDIPVCIFHSTTDEVVAFEGGPFNEPVTTYVSAITSQKGCTAAPVSNLPNIANDGITVKKTEYTCDDAQKVAYYEVTGAEHIDILMSDYQTGPNDIDYPTEIWKFFQGDDVGTDVTEIAGNSGIRIYPNPVSDVFTVSVSGKYVLKSVTGKKVKEGVVEQDGLISVSGIPAGIYIIELQSGTENIAGKLIVK